MDITFYHDTVYLFVFTEAVASFVLEWQNPGGVTERVFQKCYTKMSVWTLSYPMAGFAYILQAMDKRCG